MNKAFWLGVALTIFGVVAGCSAPEVPPGEDPIDNIDDASEYDLPEDEAGNEAAPLE